MVFETGYTVRPAFTMLQIHLKLANAPPHTYAFVFGAYCTKDGDFSQCETACAMLSVDSVANRAVALGGTGKATCVLVCTVCRAEGGKWDVCQMVTAFPAPNRNFVDSFASILSAVSDPIHAGLPIVHVTQVQIDPAMASELKKLQPTYNLSKGQTHSIPIGIEVCKFGLGWDTQCDLDASCIGLRADYGDAFICYFGNKDPIAGVVTSSGDNMSGNMWS